MSADSHSTNEPLPDDHLPDEQWSDWPTCPECQRRRQTFCPVCQTADNTFPLAEYLSATPLVEIQPTASDEPVEPTQEITEVLLMCPTCDEAFEPRFHRRCAACGHDFGDGIVLSATTREPIPPRMIQAVTLMLLGAFALIVYFWWVLNAS